MEQLKHPVFSVLVIFPITRLKKSMLPGHKYSSKTALESAILTKPKATLLWLQILDFSSVKMYISQRGIF